MKVAELKAWLDSKEPDAEVGFNMDCTHGRVELVVTEKGISKDVVTTVEL